VRTRTAEVSTTVTTSSEDSLVAAETVKSAILHVESDYANTLTILHDQVEGEILNEVGRVVPKRLTIEGVQDGMTSPVSSSCTAVGLPTLAVLERLATKGTLIDLAFLCPGEGNAIMFKLNQVDLGFDKHIYLCVTYFNDSIGSFAAHVVNSILVTKPVRTFDLDGQFSKHSKHLTMSMRTVSYICHRQSSSVIFCNKI